MLRRPSRTSVCCRRSAAPEPLTHHSTSDEAAPARLQKLTKGQSARYKSNGLSGELAWTRWYLNSWDWRCSGFASLCLRCRRSDGRPPGRSATTDFFPFLKRISAASGRFRPDSRASVRRDKPPESGNASLEFVPRPLTYQRFRQNAVFGSVMDCSWI